MSNCCRTIGLAFLLFVCGGDVALGFALEGEQEHRLFQTSNLHLITACDKSITRQTLSPHARSYDAATFIRGVRHSEGPAACGTLLSRGCLLSV
jgi:hypothetical protein